MFNHRNRPSGGRPRQGGNSFSGNRGQFRGPQGRGPAKRPQQRGQYIDPSRFIKKAQELVRIEQTEPAHAFKDFPLVDAVYRNIVAKGYLKPTPIQDQSIQYVIDGKDVLGLANTGTGKTASFLIPLIDRVYRDKTQRVVIIAPTRELAVQIQEEFRSFTPGLNLYSAICIGGTNMRNQILNVRRDPHFIIGTPGRMKDLIQQRALNLSRFNTVVLDEVDRMLDMGFIKDITFIMSLLPKQRQTLFYSATITPEIDKLIQSLLRDPIKVSVRTHETAANVDQDVVHVTHENKIDVLKDLLRTDEFRKVIIFGRTKFGVEKLSRKLDKDGFLVAAIHGNKSQSQRQNALRMFKENRVNVLIATDVAARGLDISDITHVINYDQPTTYDDYIHRIGRTGRANSTGKAITFVEGARRN